MRTGTTTFRMVEWLAKQPAPMTVSQLFGELRKDSELHKVIPSRTRLQSLLQWARQRDVVAASVWKESPVTAKNPKRLHFRFHIHADNFARLQAAQAAAAAASAAAPSAAARQK